MKPCFRTLAALLALIAFSAYFVEGVWASVCPPGMQAMGTEQATAEDAGEPACPMAAQHSPADASEIPGPSEHSGHEAPRCPLGIASGGGTCVSVSLPAATTEPVLSLREGTSLSISPEAARDLLLAAAFFRPPIQ